MLRERWQAQLENTLLRSILPIDEAQKMSPAVLCELRLRTREVGEAVMIGVARV